MHQDRFYIPYTPENDEVWIEGKEAHHILHVKRTKLDSTITLFDGKGSEYRARITEILHDKVKVCIEQTKAVSREAPVDITIAFSIPKGKLGALVIQKCSELGIRTLIPLHCERSIVDIRNKSVGKVEKWSKIAIEASKQCKRNFITRIEDVIPFDDFIKTMHDYDLPLIACTGSHTKTLKSVCNEHQSAQKIVCLIGPEGGFTHKETETAERADCIPVSISHSTLRVETAAIAVSSMLLYAYSD